MPNETGREIVVKTNPRVSWLHGRNGQYNIREVRTWIYHFVSATVVHINAVSAARGRILNGGIQLDIRAMDKLAVEWCKLRGLTVEADDV